MLVSIPTKTQIDNAIGMGWEYHGDGLFTRDIFLGYYSDRGWQKEYL